MASAFSKFPNISGPPATALPAAGNCAPPASPKHIRFDFGFQAAVNPGAKGTALSALRVNRPPYPSRTGKEYVQRDGKSEYHDDPQDQSLPNLWGLISDPEASSHPSVELVFRLSHLPIVFRMISK